MSKIVCKLWLKRLVWPTLILRIYNKQWGMLWHKRLQINNNKKFLFAEFVNTSWSKKSMWFNVGWNCSSIICFPPVLSHLNKNIFRNRNYQEDEIWQQRINEKLWNNYISSLLIKWIIFFSYTKETMIYMYDTTSNVNIYSI